MILRLKGRAAAFIAALAAILVVSSSASAAPLVNGLGGPAGYGSNELPENDDGYWPTAIDISSAFPGGLRFFGNTYNAIWVNNNGNITFRSGLSQFTPSAFPGAPQPIIAPWWGDVDTRSGGRPAHNGVYWDLRPGQFVVTWNMVDYFNSSPGSSTHHPLYNDFQLVIRAASGCGVGDFDVEFRYNQCQWVTGDASGGHDGFGGTPAVVGFDAGDSTNYVFVPGSRTMAILDVCTTSNVSTPGVWRFRIRGGRLPCVGSGDPCTDMMSTRVGACRNGVLQCRGTESVCIASTNPTTEICDGQDNDCNGMTDEGDNLCTGGRVCVAGSCVARCVEGSCFAGQTCTDQGVCVETSCIGVMCPDQQRCLGGSCVDACGGVYCPPPSVCQLGRCVDTCAGMTCDEGQVCENGRCQLNCMCRPCDTGYSCQPDGHCVQTGCVGVTCPDGQICRAGACADPCTAPGPDQTVCGHFQHCEMGHCADGPGPETDGGTNTDASTGSDGSSNPDGSTGGDGGTDGGGFHHVDNGCGCSTAGAVSPRWGWVLALAAGALVASRRRRRK